MQRKLFSSGNTPHAALSSRTVAGAAAARGDAATRGPPWIGVEMAGASPFGRWLAVHPRSGGGQGALRSCAWSIAFDACPRPERPPRLAHGTAIAVRVRTVQAACGVSRRMPAPGHCASRRHRVATAVPHDAEPTRHGDGWTIPAEREAGTCAPASPPVVPGRSSGLNATGSKRPRRIALPTQFSALRAAAGGPDCRASTQP